MDAPILIRPFYFWLRPWLCARVQGGRVRAQGVLWRGGHGLGRRLVPAARGPGPPQVRRALRAGARDGEHGSGPGPKRRRRWEHGGGWRRRKSAAEGAEGAEAGTGRLARARVEGGGGGSGTWRAAGARAKDLPMRLRGGAATRWWGGGGVTACRCRRWGAA